jgi:hypothetical protein
VTLQWEWREDWVRDDQEFDPTIDEKLLFERFLEPLPDDRVAGTQRSSPPRPTPPEQPSSPPRPTPPTPQYAQQRQSPRALGILDASQTTARSILIAWAKSDGSQSVDPPDYGSIAELSLDWDIRDSQALRTFRDWWNLSGYTPAATDNTGTAFQVTYPTAQDLAALQAWSAKKGGQLPGAGIVDVPVSKGLLAIWGRTDGRNLGVIADYGANAQDASPTWTTRDFAMLQLFQNWWNAQPGKTAIPTSGSLDSASALALKSWFAENLAAVPPGFLPPAAQQPGLPPVPTPTATCPPGKVWDQINKVCQTQLPPVPTGGGSGAGGGAGGGTKSNAVWWVLGGLAVVGIGALVVSGKSIGAALKANPTLKWHAECQKGAYRSFETKAAAEAWAKKNCRGLYRVGRNRK